jgi:hypothetical protein
MPMQLSVDIIENPSAENINNLSPSSIHSLAVSHDWNLFIHIYLDEFSFIKILISSTR